MQSTLPCRSCGTVLGIPKGGVPESGLECNWCGTLNHLSDVPTAPVPVQTKSPIEEPIQESEPNNARSQPDKPKPARHRWADDEDDDGQPYDIPESEITLRPCESCQKEIPKSAVLCVHCGHHRERKTKGERVFSAIDREWEQGWAFQRRLAVFGGCQAMNVLSLIIGISSIGQVAASLFGVITFVAVQAFILGTYPRLRVRRNKKGQAEITTTWRVLFFPLQSQKVDWRSHEGVSVGHYNGTGIIDWFIFFNLLPLIIPALLWWWYVIRADHFFTALTIQNASPETYLYRGMNEIQSKEIAQTITDATGLTLNTPLA